MMSVTTKRVSSNKCKHSNTRHVLPLKNEILETFDYQFKALPISWESELHYTLILFAQNQTNSPLLLEVLHPL